MGSNPSKQKKPPVMAPPPGRSIIRGRHGPVPGHPGTYDDIQEQLFTTNNFAPAPRNRHTVNFQDQMAEEPRQPIRNAHPGNQQPMNEVGDDVSRPQPMSRVDVLTPPNPVRQRVARPHRDWNGLWMNNHAGPSYRPYGGSMAPRYVRKPVWRYDNAPYGRRQMPPNAVYRYPHNAFLPRQRPGYMIARRLPQGPPPQGPPGYREAYIPPEPPESTSSIAQPDQGPPPYASPEQTPRDPGIGHTIVSRLVESQSERQAQPHLNAPPKRRDAYEEKNPPAPMYDGEIYTTGAAETYEVDSLLSAPKQSVVSVEDAHEEKHLSPREVEKLSREQPFKKDDDDEYIGANLRFYRNEIRFRPNGEYIDKIHRYWYCDYQRLANNTTYMPWLFPLPERSRVNPFAEPLRQHEAKHIYKDEEARTRFLTSYKMMLDFFGIELKSEKTGEVKRAQHWKERFTLLNRSNRSHGRITRILTSFGPLGFAHLQAPLVLFLFHEALETKQLSSIPRSSLQDWHRSIDNVFDANYVVNQFSKMIKKPQNNQVKEGDGVNQFIDRPSKQRMDNITEREKVPAVNQTNENLLYMFEPVDKGTQSQQANHSYKNDRVTYRDEDDRDINENILSTDDVVAGEPNTTTAEPQHPNVVNDERIDDQTPTLTRDYYDGQQAHTSTNPQYQTQPPPYSEHDSY